jgi:hypothetical protein
MLRAALREGDDTQSVLPTCKVWVAGEERFELSFCGAPRPSEIRLVKALVTARHIAAHADAYHFTSGRHQLTSVDRALCYTLPAFRRERHRAPPCTVLPGGAAMDAPPTITELAIRTLAGRMAAMSCGRDRLVGAAHRLEVGRGRHAVLVEWCALRARRAVGVRRGDDQLALRAGVPSASASASAGYVDGKAHGCQDACAVRGLPSGSVVRQIAADLIQIAGGRASTRSGAADGGGGTGPRHNEMA